MPKKIEKPTPAQKVLIEKRLRKRYPKVYKKSWVSRLKEKVKAQFAKEKLTKEQKKAKKIQATGLSRGSKRQLGQLSGSDYDAVMNILNPKEK